MVTSAVISKVDLMSDLKDLYSAPRTHPVMVDVPEMTFLAVDGHGDPAAPGYQEAIQALYTVAYTIKFGMKRSGTGLDFRVMPLESLWWTAGAAEHGLDIADRAQWRWTAMIAQPSFVTPELLARAVTEIRHRSAAPALDKVRLEAFHEGLAAQMMHVGPYSAEAPTIERLHAFIAEEGYERFGHHHEIYLSDPRRCAPDRLRTIIREPVALA